MFCKISDQVSLTEEQVWNGNDMKSSAIRFNGREGDMIKQCSGQYKKNLFCLVIVSRIYLMVMQV